jgi:hypothetical protein
MIPPEKIKRKVVGGRRRGYGGSPEHTRYSDVDYCDSDFFESQIAGLKLYVTELQRKPQAANKYEALDYNELQDFMITCNPNPGMVLINGRPDQELSREEMIEHLLKQDRFRAPLHSTTNYNYNLHHSNMIADSPARA